MGFSKNYNKTYKFCSEIEMWNFENVTVMQLVLKNNTLEEATEFNKQFTYTGVKVKYDPKYLDSHLNSNGIKQATKASQKFKNFNIPNLNTLSSKITKSTQT